MPVVQSQQSHRSPVWLPDGHFQSIYPSLFRKVIPVFNPIRERLELPDGDFLDVDWFRQSINSSEKPWVIVSHGLEGSSDRHYVLGLVNAMLEQGFNAMAWNYRSCSGEMNRNLRFYHSGATDDLDFIIHQVAARGAQDIYLAGFSLGGNMTLKWLGEQGENPPHFIRKAVAFSVPLHLSSSSKQLARWENRLYTHRFLKTLIQKVKEKSLRFPNEITTDMLASIRSLKDFDDVITGPLHGFKDAEDYYEQNSSLYFLDKIHVDTLIINAKNDPFLSAECLPVQQASAWKHVHVEIPKTGGHCGFFPRNYQGQTWSEERSIDWFRI